MAVIGTSTNYVDRTKDMYISGNLDPSVTTPQTVSYSFGSVSQYIAGPQKLAQRYLIKLINSGFVEQLLGCANSNVSVSRNLFEQMNWTIIQEFRAYQREHVLDPEDEQVSTVTLQDIIVDKDTAKFSLKLTTIAGESVTVLLPLPLI